MEYLLTLGVDPKTGIGRRRDDLTSSSHRLLCNWHPALSHFGKPATSSRYGIVVEFIGWIVKRGTIPISDEQKSAWSFCQHVGEIFAWHDRVLITND
jgi:hypothetical protein